jgi:DNA-binding NarL/FixJ family response regulator
MHPNFSGLYKDKSVHEFKFNSTRKAISQLKKDAPDFVVAEFFYGYGTNYAGINISNLDVFLFSLQKYAPNAKVIVMVDKHERQYVDKLNNILPLHAILTNPVSPAQIEALLS